MSGYTIWVWWYSLINRPPFSGGPGPTIGPSCGLVDSISCNVDNVLGTIVVEASTVSPSSVSAMLIRMTRPTPPGVAPNASMLRFVAAIPSGVATDVTAAYLARFGALPADGTTVVCEARYASADDRCASETVSAGFPVSSGGCVDSVEFSPPTQSILAGFQSASLVTPLLCDYVGVVEVALLAPDGGFSLGSSTQVQNTVEDTLNLNDNLFSARTVTVTVRYNEYLVPLRFVDITFEVTVLPF